MVEFIREVQRDIYKTLNNRFSVLEIRLTNKRRMAEEGVSKSKRDKVTRIDIIAEDKKLIEGYDIKKWRSKYGVADVKERVKYMKASLEAYGNEELVSELRKKRISRKIRWALSGVIISSK